MKMMAAFWVYISKREVPYVKVTHTPVAKKEKLEFMTDVF